MSVIEKGDYYPNCQFCAHRKECVVVKELKEAREIIQNRRKEKAMELKSVLIKGMTMPIRCENCGFMNPFQFPPTCGLTGTRILGNENARLDNCPFAEIVYCKDCKHMEEHYDMDGNVPYWTCKEWDSGTDYDGYCYLGERGNNECTD